MLTFGLWVTFCRTAPIWNWRAAFIGTVWLTWCDMFEVEGRFQLSLVPKGKRFHFTVHVNPDFTWISLLCTPYTLDCLLLWRTSIYSFYHILIGLNSKFDVVLNPYHIPFENFTNIIVEKHKSQVYVVEAGNLSPITIIWLQDNFCCVFEKRVFLASGGLMGKFELSSEFLSSCF